MRRWTPFRRSQPVATAYGGIRPSIKIARAVDVGGGGPDGEPGELVAMEPGDASGTVYLVTLWTYGGRPIFSDAASAALFCRVLGNLRGRLAFRLHAYVILPNRVRLIVGPPDPDPRSIQVIVQRLKSRFAREANSRWGRRGLVWEDADHRVGLTSLREIAKRADFLHRNPTLARLAAHPRQWRWSSYRAWSGEGKAPVAIDPPGPGAAQFI